jgi:predicted  nucleic acid-binding Zn-ribbon protein
MADTSKKHLCIVCATNEINFIAYPCGHACLCEKCKNSSLQQCVYCRANISHYNKIYINSFNDDDDGVSPIEKDIKLLDKQLEEFTKIKEDLNKKINIAEKEIIIINGHLLILQSKVSSLKHDEYGYTLTYNKYNKIKEEYNKKCIELEELVINLEDVSDQCQYTSSELSNLKQNLMTMTADKIDIEKQIESIKDEINQKQADLQFKHVPLISEVCKLWQVYDDHLAEYNYLLDKYTSVSKDKDTKTKSLNNISAEVDKLNVSINNAQETYKKKKDELEKYNKSIHNINIELNATKNKHSDIKMQIDKNNLINTVLINELKKITTDIHKNNVELLRKQINDIFATYKNSTSNIKVMQKTIQKLCTGKPFSLYSPDKTYDEGLDIYYLTIKPDGNLSLSHRSKLHIFDYNNCILANRKIINTKTSYVFVESIKTISTPIFGNEV